MTSLTANTEHAAMLVMGGENIYGATPEQFDTYLQFDSKSSSRISSDMWYVNYVGYVGEIVLLALCPPNSLILMSEH